MESFNPFNRDSDIFLSLRNNVHSLTLHPLLHQVCIATDVRNIYPGVIRKDPRVFDPFNDYAFGADVIGVDHKEFVSLLLDIANVALVKADEVNSFF